MSELDSSQIGNHIVVTSGGRTDEGQSGSYRRFAGIRIARPVIEACGFGDRIEMRVSEGTLVLAPPRSARVGWDTAFAKMAEAGDDAPLVPAHLDHDWDERE